MEGDGEGALIRYWLAIYYLTLLTTMMVEQCKVYIHPTLVILLSGHTYFMAKIKNGWCDRV